MKKTLRISVMTVLLVLISVSTYYTIVVLKARDYTKNIIAKDLRNRSWRRPNGPVHAFALDINDLTRKQIVTV